jgi:hypothetical protein
MLDGVGAKDSQEGFKEFSPMVKCESFASFAEAE